MRVSRNEAIIFWCPHHMDFGILGSLISGNKCEKDHGTEEAGWLIIWPLQRTVFRGFRKQGCL